jgi:PAS domain S-box-containing protein
MAIGFKIMVASELAYDPWWLRLGLAVYFIVLLTSSLVSEWVKEHIAWAFAVGALGLSAWMGFLLYKNHFAADFMASYYILSVSSALLFDERVKMAFFTVASGVILTLLVLISPDATNEVWLFLLINILIFIMGNAVVTVRSSSHTQYELELSHLLTIQEAAVESNSDAILLVDQEGNYLKANSAFSTMWRIPMDMVNRNQLLETEKIALDQVTHPEELIKVWSLSEGGLKMGEIREVEFRDGRVVEVYWRPMIYEDTLVGRLWLFRDITRRKAKEQRLIATERQLRRQNERLMEFASSFVTHAGNIEESFKEITSVSAELLDVDTVGVWFFDQETGTMRQRLQYDRQLQEFKRGASVLLTDHPEYFEELFKSRVLAVGDTLKNASTKAFYEGAYSGRAVALMHAQIRAQGTCIGIMSFECSSGTRQWTPEEKNYAASLADLVSIAMASEEKVRAQFELTSSTAILQAIFDLSETGIIVEDVDHNILKYNELYLKIWNMTKEFVDTQPYSVLLARCLEQLKNVQSIQEGLDKIKLRPGMEYAGIMEFNDGKVVERYSKALMVNGELKGRVWFYLDITERKRKENELINRNFELDSFVYRASHDLKAPLNSIMGLISLIREEPEIDTILRYVSMMDKSVKKLDDFIKQLTQFSQDARLKIVRKPIHFKELVEDTFADLKFMDNAARIHLTVDVEQNRVFHSDPVRLGIVFSNFLSNAIKYQDLKKERSTLLVHIRADEEQAVCRFEDNGLGIDSEHVEKVFDLFFRASVQATGSGLGLYITHNAIQKLGGSVKVTSDLGKGTAFILTIPNIPSEDEGTEDKGQGTV